LVQDAVERVVALFVAARINACRAAREVAICAQANQPGPNSGDAPDATGRGRLNREGACGSPRYGL
jgi:hypothetical protein